MSVVGRSGSVDRRRDRFQAILASLGLALLGAACATAGGVPTSAPAPSQAPAGAPATPDSAAVPFRGVPGFDTRTFPGDTVMQRWRAESPYRWVGYYLPAPCHTDSTWLGKRAALERAGWGVAILYVGEQDWASAAPVAGPSGSAAVQNPRCTRANLTQERGAADALEADSLAAGEGFAPGSAIFLDVERVNTVSPELAAYVRAWATSLLDRGRYVPALYAHARNADTLRTAIEGELSRRGRPAAVKVWLAAAGTGFDVHAAPAESGATGVSVWQGAVDVRESHGGKTLRIDVNVADSPSPSAPPGR